MIFYYAQISVVQPSVEKLPPAADVRVLIQRSTARYYADCETLEHKVLNGLSLSNPSPRNSGNPAEGEVVKV